MRWKRCRSAGQDVAEFSRNVCELVFGSAEMVTGDVLVGVKLALPSNRADVGNQRALTSLGGHLGFPWDRELVHHHGEMSRVRPKAGEEGERREERGDFSCNYGSVAGTPDERRPSRKLGQDLSPSRPLPLEAEKRGIPHLPFSPFALLQQPTMGNNASKP
ncbi:hypothetical protein KM043_004764 [Ampulex compressa]|nr:hypothetical protein KM043_004764 [Ampulex compressa]